MKVSRLTVAALAAVMILSVLSPLGAVAADKGDLSIDVEQNGDVLVTVTDEENTTLENATVNVSVEDGVDYEGAGENTTDESGTVEFPEPEETVNVTIEATDDDGVSTETEETLEAPEDEDLELSIDVEQDGDALVTVTDDVTGDPVEADVNVSTVEENASYDGVDKYEDVENGTVELPEPEETVEVSITASYENESVTDEVTLKSTEDQIVEENDTFGSMVSSFVGTLEPSDGDGDIGPQVASFVLEHNPGNAPDHAGPPEHAGPDGNETEQGPPENPGPNGDNQGPPENPGPDNDSEQDNGESGDSDNGNGGGQGPPSDAGPGGN